MKNIEKKDKIQKEALNKWLSVNKCGTTEIITGLGKTFIALHALYTMPRDDKTHVFLAEVKDREKDLMADILKYNIIFKRNVLKDYNLEFYCYQTVYKWKNKNFGLVIADEIHDSLSPSYVQFYNNNKYDAILGLSATIKKDIIYAADDGSTYTKGDLLNRIAPICFKYNLKQAEIDSTTRKLNIHVIQTSLNDTEKVIKAGNAKKRFLQTETAAYNYWDNQFKRALFIIDEDTKTRMIATASRKRKDIIYNSLGKIDATKKLVKYLTNNKTLLFGNSIDSLLKITKNVVSSRNKDDVNDEIRDKFNKSNKGLIGSFKKLKQGANIEGLDSVILMSYYGVALDWIQRIGRLRDNGEEGDVYILLTKNTQEEIWFNNMLQDFNKDNIKYYNNIDHFLRKK